MRIVRLWEEMSMENRFFIEKNIIWRFHCLSWKVKLTPSRKKKYNDFMDLIIKEGMDWTIAYYKDLIAFKNPADRTTYIYEKEYFIRRFEDGGDNSILNCKSINLG